MARFAKLLKSHASKESCSSDVHCPRHQQTHLGKWIRVSGKKRADYVFPGRRGRSSHPMTVRQMGRLLKLWVAEAGLDPNKYGTESLRRTKALHILNGTGDLETVRVLLGHTNAPPVNRISKWTLCPS